MEVAPNLYRTLEEEKDFATIINYKQQNLILIHESIEWMSWWEANDGFTCTFLNILQFTAVAKDSSIPIEIKEVFLRQEPELSLVDNYAFSTEFKKVFGYEHSSWISNKWSCKNFLYWHSTTTRDFSIPVSLLESLTSFCLKITLESTDREMFR